VSSPGASARTGLDRAAAIERLKETTFDVLVIGGGITGAGVALDAVSRGHVTALVERDDFASGTSSKSSKLIHGGLRYLQQGDVRLVYEALHERKRLRRNAPHLVRVLPFMIPILTKDGLISKKIARALGSALWMYDITGGWRIGRLHRRLSGKAAQAHLPTMRAERLASAYLYFDAEADDARLTLTVVRTAVDMGSVAANRIEVTGIKRHDKESTVTLRDILTGQTFDARARSVVNATGVWADDLRQLDEGSHPRTIRPAKGVHVTVPWHKVRNDIAVVIPVPKDKRSLFVVPWVPNGDGTYKYTYIGTTDTDYKGPVDEPQCTKDDIDYVLRALNASVTTNVTHDDVLAVWSGLRPLVTTSSDSKAAARTADLSRRHSVSTSTNGMVTVTGGKLTTYREMAEDAVDEVDSLLGTSGRCRTKRLKLRGHEGFRPVERPDWLTDATIDHLDNRYGSDAGRIIEIAKNDPQLARPLVDGLPYLRAEAVYSVTHEMALSLDDIMTRRTRARLFDRRATVNAASDTARLVAPLLSWSEADIDREVRTFVDSCAREDAAAMVTEDEFIASTTATGQNLGDRT
jgi:glycerol-3-phosphate dehydrogenase